MKNFFTTFAKCQDSQDSFGGSRLLFQTQVKGQALSQVVVIEISAIKLDGVKSASGNDLILLVS